jgi:hypothetical protein
MLAHIGDVAGPDRILHRCAGDGCLTHTREGYCETRDEERGSQREDEPERQAPQAAVVAAGHGRSILGI